VDVTAALGWLGMGGTFLAYLLLSRGRLASESFTYAMLNAVGGLLGGAASVAYGAWPSAVSNLVWAMLGLQSAVVASRRSARTSPCQDWASDLMPEAAPDCLV
jgi:hypothetical protein